MNDYECLMRCCGASYKLKKRRDIVIKLKETAKEKYDLELVLRMEKEKRDINLIIKSLVDNCIKYGYDVLKDLKDIVKEQHKIYESNIKRYSEIIYVRDKYGYNVIWDYDTGEPF